MSTLCRPDGAGRAHRLGRNLHPLSSAEVCDLRECGGFSYRDASAEDRVVMSEIVRTDGFDSSWLFVDGLPLNYRAEDLQIVFAQVGLVRSCRIVTDPMGQSLRCAYVEMASHRDAERALLLQLKTIGMTALQDLRIVHCVPPA